MDSSDEIVRSEDRTPTLPCRDRIRRAAWVIGLLAVVIVAALAFVAYRQPELLLNFIGLRYCG
jgi:hypothetical protein